MSPTLHWIAAPPASLAHAAAMLARGHALLDADLAQRLGPIVAAAEQDLSDANIDRREFWANLVPSSAGLASPLNVEIYARLTSALQACDSASISREELELRAGPLREAWDARGPGLWSSLRRAAREELGLPSASVILVRPVLGGGGTPFARHCAISFESLLVNPQRELPEVVRLAWLLAQLQFAAATQSQNGSLALIPPVLAAADDVELARCDLPTIRLAIRAWHLANDESTCEALAARVYAWWRAVENRKLNLREVVAKFV